AGRTRSSQGQLQYAGGLKRRGHRHPAMRSPHDFLLRAGSALLLLTLLAAPAAAGEIRIDSFRSEIVVLPDSTIDVTETIATQFLTPGNGIFRTIPVQYTGLSGFNYSLFLTHVGATDGAGGPALRIEKSRQGPNLEFKIFVPGAEG